MRKTKIARRLIVAKNRAFFNWKGRIWFILFNSTHLSVRCWKETGTAFWNHRYWSSTNALSAKPMKNLWHQIVPRYNYPGSFNFLYSSADLFREYTLDSSTCRILASNARILVRHASNSRRTPYRKYFSSALPASLNSSSSSHYFAFMAMNAEL